MCGAIAYFWRLNANYRGISAHNYIIVIIHETFFFLKLKKKKREVGTFITKDASQMRRAMNDLYTELIYRKHD